MLLLSHVHAAVYWQVCSGHVGVAIIGQETDHVGDFIGVGHASHRHLLDNRIADIFGNGVGHFGFDVTRGNRINGDALVGQFLCNSLCESMQTCLAGGIVSLPKLSLLSVHRTDIDESTKGLVRHVIDPMACYI